VAGVWDGSSLKLFVDGQEVPGALTVQGSFPTTMLDSSIRANIGSFESDVNGNRVNFFEGLIDEVKIYNRALSDAEIHAIFLQNKCQDAPIAIDLSQDFLINLIDFEMLANDWLARFGMTELLDMSNHWLECSHPDGCV